MPIVLKLRPVPRLAEDASLQDAEVFEDVPICEDVETTTENIPLQDVEVYNADDYDPDRLPPYVIYEPLDYRDGPEGFIKWCEDMVYIPIYPDGSDIAVWESIAKLDTSIHPKSGKSYDYIWKMQKEEIRKCLRMVKGRFVYRLIILSWMRGEGKSLLACLIQLWKFFCWPKQTIVLGANSKDQIRFVHYDIMRDIINNSPKLLNTIGERNIQEKEIRLRDPSGNVSSVLRPISSFSGIVSNITGYTFSEIFDMKNPKFFTQLDGSIRNIPNALGVIDSTVSPKTHVLYKMYTAFMDRETKTLFFSYRCSKNAVIEDYWNPNMDQQQLDDYKAKFPLGDFEKYFMNVWSSNATQVFTESMIEATNHLGIDGRISSGHDLRTFIDELYAEIGKYEEWNRTRNTSSMDLTSYTNKIREYKQKLYPVESVYKIRNEYGHQELAPFEALPALSELFDTNWSILVGIDRADPLKNESTVARTMMTVMAKGLVGSRTNVYACSDDGNPRYMYFVLGLVQIGNSSLDNIKNVILEAHDIYKGIDAVCGERWGLWDIAPWCEEQNILCELIHPSYDKQKAAFSELYGVIASGRFKIPPSGVWGTKEQDIFKEEALIFFHDEDKRWFGSPEKASKNGAQDDTMFATAWGLYGGRFFRAEDFRERSGGNHYYGTMILNRSHLTSKI